jgi:hypothetical protein
MNIHIVREDKIDNQNILENQKKNLCVDNNRNKQRTDIIRQFVQYQ